MNKKRINLKDYAIKIIKSEKEIKEVKALDDFVFGGRHIVTLKELHKVKKVGIIFALYNTKTGVIAGEALLLFHPISEIPYTFENPVGYCYRVGIHPDFQGCGLGKVLITKIWEAALSNGVEELRLSVRPENFISLKLMFSQDFHIIEYKKDFCRLKEGLKDPRFIMSKKKELENENFLTKKMVPTPASASVEKYREQIESLILQGFRGVGIDGLGIEFAR